MSFISNIANSFGYYRLDDDRATEILGLGMNGIVSKATERNMTQISAVYRAIGLIANTIGYLNIHVLQDDGTNGKKRLYDHPNHKLLNRTPNGIMRALKWKQTMQQLVLRWGNAYSEIKRYPSGNQLMIIHPSKVTPQIYQFPTGGYDVKYIVAGRAAAISSSDMIHFTGLTLDGVKGQSPIADMRLALDGELTRMSFNKQFYENGANISSVLKVKKSLGNTMEQKRAAKQLMLDDFKNRNVGLDKAHSIAVIDEDAELIKLGVSPKEAQFIETGQYTLADVGRFFHVNLAYLYASEGKYNNYEHMNTEFYAHTMLPWFKQWEEELDAKLLTDDELDRGIKHKFSVKGLLRADVKTRGEFYQTLTNVKAITPNEIRDLEDMNPQDWGNQPLHSKNFFHPEETIQ